MNHDRWAILYPRAILALGGLLFAFWALRYVVDPLPPFGYYYDLGVNIQATEDIDAAINSPTDLKDAVGWAGWDNGPQFVYAPLTTYAILVPLAKLLKHDAFTAVKLMQVLEFLLACFGMAWLYQTFRGRRSIWGNFAGIVFMLMPVTAPEIRGNVEFGLMIACAPIGMACGVLLVRRFGSRALPLAGVAVALLSSCVVAESFFFVTIPSYAIVAFSNMPRANRYRWILFATLGLVAAAAAAAYYALPTVAARALFTNPATRISLLQSGEFSFFSQDWLGLLALVPREQTISPFSLFNAGNDVGLAGFASVMFWGAAVAYVIRRKARSRLTSEESAFAWVGIVCVLLGLGANLPAIGPPFWSTIAHIPILEFIRTPDRFMLVAVIAIILLAFRFLEEAAARGEALRRLVLCTVSLACVILASFDLLQHCLSLEPNWDQEPNIREVQDNLTKLGAKRLSLALVKDGSALDFPYYGAGISYDRFAWDLMSRYAEDGIGGIGFARRLGVAGVAATPNWSNDAPLLPDFDATMRRSPLLRVVYSRPDSPSVFAVKGTRNSITAVRIDCLSGGPGMLDQMYGLRRYSQSAFVRRACGSKEEVRADFDPMEAAVRRLPHVSGSALFPGATLIMDNDYPFTMGRTYINDRWYRNAIDGDAVAISPTAAVEVNSTSKGTWNIVLGSGGEFDLAVRAVCHAPSQFIVAIDGSQRSLYCRQSQGFQWLILPLGALKGGAHRITLSDPTANQDPSTQAWAMAVDGAALIPARMSLVSFVHAPSDELFALSHFRPARAATPPGSGFVALRGFANRATGSYVETFRWTGPPGLYRVVAAGKLPPDDSTISISHGVGEAACCLASMPSTDEDSAQLTSVSADIQLHSNDVVGVIITPDRGIGRNVADSVALDASLLGGTLPTAGIDEAKSSFAAPIGRMGLTLQAGEHISFGAAPGPHAFRAILKVESSGGSGTVGLRCNGHGETASLTPGAVLASEGYDLSDCMVTINAAGELTLSEIRLVVDHSQIPDLAGRRYITAGSYAVHVISSRGAFLRTAVVTVDGRAIGTEAVITRSGYHTIGIRNVGRQGNILAFFLNQSLPLPPRLGVDRVSTSRWRIEVPSATAVEAAVVPDGNWVLFPTRGSRIYGERCDLINTCFVDVPPGEYLLVHLWPLSVKLGLLITGLVVVAALSCVFIGRDRVRQLTKNGVGIAT